MKKRVLFIYRHNELNNILLPNGGIRGPTDFLFGMNLLSKKKYEISYINAPRGTRKSIIEKLCFLIEKPFNKRTKLGLPIDIYFLFRKQVNKADVLFCNNDPISLGILFWKKLGFIKAEIIVLMQSLPERIKYFRHNHFVRKLISSLLHQAKITLTLSNFVQKDFIADFNLDPKKVKTFYFGVDTNFWRKISSTGEEDFILSVGNDMNRDYETLIKALPKSIKLKIITRKKVATDGKNIEFLSGISDESLRKLYNQCLFAVIPSIKLKNESSGLSSCLQLMACKKAVIVSKAPPLEEIFIDKKHCIFYRPEDVNDLRKKTISLYKNKTLRKKIAKNALFNVQKFKHEIMAKRLNTLL